MGIFHWKYAGSAFDLNRVPFSILGMVLVRVEPRNEDGNVISSEVCALQKRFLQTWYRWESLILFNLLRYQTSAETCGLDTEISSIPLPLLYHTSTPPSTASIPLTPYLPLLPLPSLFPNSRSF